MTLTDEQSLCIFAVTSSSSNLLVTAYAGCGKTSTLVHMVAAAAPTPVLALAFNKKIAVEMEKRLPVFATSKTLNGLGHGVWSRAVSPKLTIDFAKNLNIVKSLQDSVPNRKTFPFSDILSGLRSAKQLGYVPPGPYYDKSLISREAFFKDLEEEVDIATATYIDEALLLSIKFAYRGAIDFDDQIYMPTCFGGTFPQFPIVCIDEAQDLSPLNHAMLRKLARQRLIVVGDPNQSIYGFRGAVAEGMTQLHTDYSMSDLKLSTSFRCPEAIVENSRWHVPDFKSNIPGGIINVLEEWGSSTIASGDVAIICRNNAPLFKTAMRLLAAGRSVQLVGSDIGPALIKIMEKLGDASLSSEKVHTKIDDWASQQAKRSRNKGNLADRVECLHVFADAAQTLSGIIFYMKHLFAQEGKVKLMSGHKAKGLEFDTVYHLDSWRIPGQYAKTEEEFRQENNVKYVIETRAKRELNYITEEGYKL